MEGLSFLEMLLEQGDKEIPEVKKKEFSPKYPGMKLEDYGQPPGEDFWRKVKKNRWEDLRERKSDINEGKLLEMALETDYPNKAVLGRAIQDLKEGDKIGVEGNYRVASTSTNAPSALDHGEEVTDALLDWLHDFYCIGPYDQDEVPIEEAKISGLMCRMKPNGKARIIINLSKGKPSSVNEEVCQPH